MAQKESDLCRNCGAELAPGAAFCTLCGAAVANRAASPAPTSVPLGAPAQNTQPSTLPGIIEVGMSSTAPLMAPQHLGVDPRIAAATALVPGGAGRRLGAKVIDGVLPFILVGVAAGIGALNIKTTQMGSSVQLDLSWLLILISIASLLSLAYGIWLWLWEAKSGKTPGNLMVGLRTTNMAGGPAGVLAIFLRYLIIGVSNIVPTVGPLLVIISNTWDSNQKKQGWHDKVAHTLVFNVKTGRDPLETGGIAERENFSPAGVPTISEVRSPLSRPAPNSADNSFAPQQFAPQPVVFQNQQQPKQQGRQENPFAPPLAPHAPPTQTPAENGPISSIPGFSTKFVPERPTGHTAPTVPDPFAHAPLAAADDEVGETRVRPEPAIPALRLRFDDGRFEDVNALALIGRNPAGYDGEMISRLISVQDSSRSVSKTHLHLRVGAEGLWVTDRNSTNGSAITNSAGVMKPLSAGAPALADLGSRVNFGDRSFVVGRA